MLRKLLLWAGGTDQQDRTDYSKSERFRQDALASSVLMSGVWSFASCLLLLSVAQVSAPLTVMVAVAFSALVVSLHRQIALASSDSTLLDRRQTLLFRAIKLTLGAALAASVAATTTFPVLLAIFKHELAPAGSAGGLLAMSNALSDLLSNDPTARLVAISIAGLIVFLELMPVAINLTFKPSAQEQRLLQSLADASASLEATRNMLSDANRQFERESKRYDAEFDGRLKSLSKPLTEH